MQIQDYVAKGYARKLKPHELNEKHPRTWYLPIFAVTNPNKPNRIRIVWDAAAKVSGISLNDALLKGPDQFTLLPGVLQRFREKPIAVTGDIQEMFHQIKIRKQDQHSQRFLWNNSKNKEDIDVYVMQVMTFGATCSPSTAQYIKNRNANEFKHTFPRASEAIINNHYVDDMLDCAKTEEDAIKLAREVKYIHQQAGLVMRKWASNSESVVRALAETDCITERDINLNKDSMTKVLGLWWRCKDDVFVFARGESVTSIIG